MENPWNSRLIRVQMCYSTESVQKHTRCQSQAHVETDHKQLVPLLCAKRLDKLPLCVQRFRMRSLSLSKAILLSCPELTVEKSCWSQLASVPVYSTNSMMDYKVSAKHWMWWPGLCRHIMKTCQDCLKTLCKDQNHLTFQYATTSKGGLICLSGTSPHTCL